MLTATCLQCLQLCPSSLTGSEKLQNENVGNYAMMCDSGRSWNNDISDKYVTDMCQ